MDEGSKDTKKCSIDKNIVLHYYNLAIGYFMS